MTDSYYEERAARHKKYREKLTRNGVAVPPFTPVPNPNRDPEFLMKNITTAKLTDPIWSRRLYLACVSRIPEKVIKHLTDIDLLDSLIAQSLWTEPNLDNLNSAVQVLRCYDRTNEENKQRIYQWITRLAQLQFGFPLPLQYKHYYLVDDITVKPLTIEPVKPTILKTCDLCECKYFTEYPTCPPCRKKIANGQLRLSDDCNKCGRPFTNRYTVGVKGYVAKFRKGMCRTCYEHEKNLTAYEDIATVEDKPRVKGKSTGRPQKPILDFYLCTTCLRYMYHPKHPQGYRKPGSVRRHNDILCSPCYQKARGNK